MSLKRKRSALVDLFRHGRGGERAPGAGATDEDAPPTNAGSGPASTTWRRKRLLDIGHEGQGSGLAAPAGEGSNAVTETSSLRRGRNDASYGTLASPGYSPTRSRFRPNASLRVTRRVRSLSDDAHLASGPVSGLTARMPRSPMANSIRERTSVYFNIPTERPIAAYDAPLLQDIKKLEHEVTGGEVPLSAQVNGLRVWYASFTSIDWLHDSIKDAVRRGRLQSHKHKSVRGRVRAAADRLVGWVIVTVVGVLTAIAAFAIVRTEMMFFDWKEGYCAGAWWKAHRFCCPRLEDAEDAGLGLWRSTNASTSWPNFSVMNLGQPLAAAAEETCSAWRTWSEVFGETAEHRGSWVGLKADMAEYIAYALIASLLAVGASLLTIHLTASTSFATRKESAVFADTDEKGLQGPPRKTLYYASGSGISEVKTVLSGYVIHGYLGGRTLFTKSLGLAMSVGSGLTLGKEGPFVHIASCIGNIVSRGWGKYDHNEGKRREILSAASAAGVAVAFGAPIGGVLFSLEEVSYFFPAKVMWKTFFCAAIAAMTLRFLDPFGTGKLVLFQVTYDKDWHAAELVPFVFLGIFGGLYGAVFTNLNVKWAKHVRGKTWMKTHPVWEVLAITLLTTLLCFVNPYTRMGGTELVYNLFAECRTGGSNHSGLCVLDPGTQAWPIVRGILTALVVKGLLTIVTFGIKLPAGIFIPTLGVGACAGRALGIWIQYLHWKHPESRVFAACNGDLDCVIPGLYAMVGAAAALSGVTRTTVSLVVIMFELTDTLAYVVPLMLSVLVAKTVADALEPKGIYDLVIEMNQLPFLDAKHDYHWNEYELRDIADSEIPVIRVDGDNTVRHVRDVLIAFVQAGYEDGVIPVLKGFEDEEKLVGVIGAGELEHALSIVADDPDGKVHFNLMQKTHVYGEMSVASLDRAADGQVSDPYDFGVYMDQAPLTVHHFAPLELVHQFFAKLGAKYVVVTDPDGAYGGVVDKTAWLAFLGEIERKAHH